MKKTHLVAPVLIIIGLVVSVLVHNPYTHTLGLTAALADSVSSTPTCSITITPSTVAPNAPFAMTWASAGATSFNYSYILNGVETSIGALALNGSLNSTALPTAGLYTLVGSVSGPGGTAKCTTPFQIVLPSTPAPTCTIAISPTTTTPGAPFTLTWTSAGATSFNYSYILNGIETPVNTFALNGSLKSTAIGTTGNFTLVGTVSGPGGTTKCTTPFQVNRTPASPLLITDKPYYLGGQSMYAEWSNIPSPASTDWIGIAPAGGNWQQGWLWTFGSGMWSGEESIALPVGATPGAYDLVYYRGYTPNNVEIARSSTFNIVTQAPLPPAPCTSTYDLLIKNGSVIDPSQNLHASTTSIGIKNGIVTAIGPNLNPAQACQVYDAAGKTVAPGFVDLHTHFASPAWPQSGFGVNVNTVASTRGYTTMVSAGDAGLSDAAAFKAAKGLYLPRTFALLNVSRTGAAAAFPNNEAADQYDDPNAMGTFLAANADFYLGLKVRSQPNGLLIGTIQKAVAAANKATQISGRAFPIMVHIGGLDSTSTIDDVVATLRPGDIITHAYSVVLGPQGLPTGFAQNAVCKPSAAAALQKGIVLDLGASITASATDDAWFDPWSYLICAKAGISPTTVSSDEYDIPVLSMADVGSILLGLNNGNNVSPLWAPAAGPIPTPLTLDDVIYKMTRAPALALGDRAPALLGTLQVGAPGDVVILNVQSGSFQYKIWQPSGSPVTVTTPTKINVETTFKAGKQL